MTVMTLSIPSCTLVILWTPVVCLATSETLGIIVFVVGAEWLFFLDSLDCQFSEILPFSSVLQLLHAFLRTFFSSKYSEDHVEVRLAIWVLRKDSFLRSLPDTSRNEFHSKLVIFVRPFAF